MGNSKSAAGCQAAPGVQAPTVRQAAERLLAALDILARGSEIPGFAGWENGFGEPAGDAVDEARHELREVLARPTTLYRSFTDEEFEPEIFERIWRSSEVQDAGRSTGWRGIAEAVWASALREFRAGATQHPTSEKNLCDSEDSVQRRVQDA